MKVWITKYALSTGIMEAEAEECQGHHDMVQVVESNWKIYYHGLGKEWHTTLEAAQAKAEEMRVKKIAGLKKKIQQLEKLVMKVKAHP